MPGTVVAVPRRGRPVVCVNVYFYFQMRLAFSLSLSLCPNTSKKYQEDDCPRVYVVQLVTIIATTYTMVLIERRGISAYARKDALKGGNCGPLWAIVRTDHFPQWPLIICLLSHGHSSIPSVAGGQLRHRQRQPPCDTVARLKV